MTDDEYPLTWKNVMSRVGVYERETPIDGKDGRFVVIVENRNQVPEAFLLEPTSTKATSPYNMVVINPESVLTQDNHPEPGRNKWRRITGLKAAVVLTLTNGDEDE